MKTALVCVSFGTSVPAARENITAVEAALRREMPQAEFVRAFTSGIIRRVLAARGEAIPSLGEALDALARQGCTRVAVQPTHLLYGVEYDRLKAEADARADRFKALALGAPLLADNGDLLRLAEILSRAYPAVPGEALVLMGHGTPHFANAVYPALQTVFCLAGRTDVLVGTVEGWPTLAQVRAQLQKRGTKRVRLAPMMLVAGDHALNDMAGSGADSWQSVLTRDGCAVRCALQGLGVLSGVQQMYAEHLRAALGGQNHGV